MSISMTCWHSMLSVLRKMYSHSTLHLQGVAANAIKYEFKKNHTILVSHRVWYGPTWFWIVSLNRLSPGCITSPRRDWWLYRHLNIIRVGLNNAATSRILDNSAAIPVRRQLQICISDSVYFCVNYSQKEGKNSAKGDNCP